MIASYCAPGDHFALAGTNSMTPSEKEWWKQHGQEIVDTMASANGPDVVGLLHDCTSYGVYGDHGGAKEAVQRVPMVFWSPGIAFAQRHRDRSAPRTSCRRSCSAMGIPLTPPVDGQARALH